MRHLPTRIKTNKVGGWFAFHLHLCGMQWVWHNGKMVREDTPLFTAANNSFKWGDGLFETALFYKGRMLLAPFHWERLAAGMSVLQMLPVFTETQLVQAVAELCAANNCSAQARVRVAVYRAADGMAACVISATAHAGMAAEWNETGWTAVTYPHARKSCDAFANLKSANYLPYLMATRYAAAQGADESLVLNSVERICEGSKTNVFIATGDAFITPPLTEGCVAGVMRRYVMQQFRTLGAAVHEQPFTPAMIENARAVFVTNAVEGMRWVRSVDGKMFGHGDLKKWHAAVMAPLYAGNFL